MARTVICHDEHLRVFDHIITDKSNVSASVLHILDLGDEGAITSIDNDNWQLHSYLVLKQGLLRFLIEIFPLESLTPIRISQWYEYLTELYRKNH